MSALISLPKVTARSRADLSYLKIPFTTLVQEIQTIQDIDCDWLTIQFKNYNERNSTFRSRLDWNNQRYALINELICRLQAFHIQIVLLAIDQAYNEAIKRGKPDNFTLHIIFDGSPNPIIYII